MNKCSKLSAFALSTILIAASQFANATEVRVIATGEIYNFVDPADILGYGGTGGADGTRVTFYFTYDTETAASDYYGGARFPLEADYFTQGNSSTAPSWVSSYIEFDNGTIYSLSNYDGTVATTDQVKIIERDAGSTFDYIGFYDEKVDSTRGGHLGVVIYEYVNNLVNGIDIEQFPNWTNAGGSFPNNPDGNFAFVDNTAGWAFDGRVIIDSLIVTGYSEYTATFAFPGGSIFGHLPVPQINGFDYYFTPVVSDATILGDDVTIESVDVSAFGQNNGDVVNFDWEVYLGPASFGMPEGQLIDTLVDPITGYARIAPTQFRFVIGNQVDDQSYQFSGQHNFVSATTTASPYLSLVQEAFTLPMNLTEGLYAQVFLWTADNRNSQIDFGEILLTVQGKMRIAPEVVEIPVSIDIKPGDEQNKINPSSTGTISVAVLAASDTPFDPLQIDVATVRFGPNEAMAIRNKVTDNNQDGLADLLLRFEIRNTGIQCGDTEATLTGETYDGLGFTGTDSIKTVRCH